MDHACHVRPAAAVLPWGIDRIAWRPQPFVRSVRWKNWIRACRSLLGGNAKSDGLPTKARVSSMLATIVLR